MTGARYYREAVAVGSLVASAWALMPAGAAAQPGMYRCKSASGTWEFLDRPCPTGSKLLVAPPPAPEPYWPVTVTPLHDDKADREAAQARAAAAAQAAADAGYWGGWPYPAPRRWRR